MRMRAAAGALLALCTSDAGAAQDALERPPGVRAGDPVAGRAIVADRRKGLCLLCHSGPFPEERFQGDLAPDLAGAGARLTEGQIRLRIADGRRLNPDTIMPSYARNEAFERIAPAYAGRPLLTLEEIEDVTAFLVTLKEPPQ